MNRVELRGGLTADPKIEYLPSGDPVVSFTLAVNDTRWDSKAESQVVTTSYIRCRMFSDVAMDVLDDKRGFGKGDDVYLLGKLEQIVVEKDSDPSKTERKTGVVVFQLTVVRRRRPPQAAAQTDPWAK